MLLGMAMLLRLRRAVDALTLGEETAASLGVDIARARLFAIVGTAIAVGAAVAVSGVIGFVGLVAPHLVRTACRQQPGDTLAPAMLAGAALLLASDVALRLFTFGPELKLGVLTALVGAPFFLALIARSRREGW
jgi:iron complex transport system permease protein